MLQKIPKWLFNILFALTFVSAGFAIGFSAMSENSTIKPELDIVSVISLCVNAVFAWYLTGILPKRAETDKRDKDVVFSRLDHIVKDYDSFAELVTRNNMHLTTITSFCKRTSMSVSSVCTSYVTIHKLPEFDEKKSVVENIRRLKEIMTLTPVIQEGDDRPITVVDGILKFSQVRQDEILTAINNTINAIIALQLRINGS